MERRFRNQGIMESPVRVMSVIPRSVNALSVRMERPPGFDHLPGQYMFLTLGEGETSLVKHLTISSSPTEPFLEVTKGMTGHPFAEALKALSPGDTLAIRGPYGEFTFTGEYDKVVFLSGGIGITPLRSMMRYATDRRLGCSIVLLYSCRGREDILFGDEMEALQRENGRFRSLVTLTRPDPAWSGLSGRIDSELIEREVPDWRERVFFISGPGVMVDAMSTLVTGMGVPEGQVKREVFPGY
jgi:ferredoxin-NADP reductase